MVGVFCYDLCGWLYVGVVWYVVGGFEGVGNFGLGVFVGLGGGCGY